VRLTGTERLAVSRAALWSVVEDPERLGEALPHVDDLVVLEDGGFEATIRPALALGEIPFRTAWRRDGAVAGEALSYSVTGRSDEYVFALRADLRLAGSDGSTTLEWQVEGGFTGTMRAVGQRVLDAIVRHQVGLVLAAAADQARAAEDGGGR
jgi:carbon monoxide dehydrogenase subunit G